VPGLAVGSQLHPEDPLLADAECVEAPATEFERLTAALVDDEIAAHGVGLLAAKPHRAQPATDLLVGGDHQLELPR
jgi:hypothetical protein